MQTGNDQTVFQPVCQYGDAAGALTARNDSSPCPDRGQTVVAVAANQRGEVRLEQGDGSVHGCLPTTRSAKQVQAVTDGYVVRRLTPTECERLQGMPDGHTKVPYRGKPAEECPDGPRYKAIGNSMCVNVMRWIGERIQEVEQWNTLNT